LPGLMFTRGAPLPVGWDEPAHDLPLHAQHEGEAGVRLSRIANGIWNRDPPARDARYTVFVDGEIGGRDALWRRLGPSDVACPTSDAALLLALLQSGASLEDCLRQCDGGFFLAVHDRQQGRIRFANDRFGLRPHYYSARPEGVVLAPTLGACLDAPWVSRTLDPLSVAEYFCCQCVLEERTLLRDVQLFPAGSIAELDLGSGGFAVRPYWHWSELQATTSTPTFAAAVDEVAHLFRAACTESGREGERRGVYLSGGLDSRLIVAALGGGDGLHTICFGPPDSPDIVYARRAARAAGTHHHEFLMHDGQWLRGLAARHARLTEGGHGLSHAHNLWRVEEAAACMNVNLSGHFGDLLLGGSYVYDGPAAGVRESLYRIFTGKWGGGFGDPAQFAAAFALPAPSLVERMRAAFDASFAPFADLPPAMAHDLFALQFHGRKQIQYYLVHNRPWIESRTPFLDVALLRCLYGLPPAFRADRRLQCAVLERYSPALAAVPWAGTRLPAANRGLAKVRTRVEERLADVSQRLTGTGGVAPRGRLLNHCYPDWLRNDLAGWVSETLGAGRGHVERLFRPGALQGIVERLRAAADPAAAVTVTLALSLEHLTSQLRLEY